MKRFFLLALSALMTLSLFSCTLKPKLKEYGAKPEPEKKSASQSVEQPAAPGEQTPIEQAPKKDEIDYKIEAFVKNKRTDLVYTMSKMFENATKSPCDTTVEAEGKGIVFTIRVGNLHDVPEAARPEFEDQMVGSYPLLMEALNRLQADVPEIKYLIINFCEEDGTPITTFRVPKDDYFGVS